MSRVLVTMCWQWGLLIDLQVPTMTPPRLHSSLGCVEPSVSVCLSFGISAFFALALALHHKTNPSYSLWLFPFQWIVLEGKLEGRRRLCVEKLTP